MEAAAAALQFPRESDLKKKRLSFTNIERQVILRRLQYYEGLDLFYWKLA